MYKHSLLYYDFSLYFHLVCFTRVLTSIVASYNTSIKNPGAKNMSLDILPNTRAYIKNLVLYYPEGIKM